MFLLINAIFYLAALYMLSALFHFWCRLMVSEVNLSFFTPCLLNNASARLFILGDEAISALIEALESEESVLARGDVDIVENAGLKLVVEGETVCDLGECDIATRLLTWAIAHTVFGKISTC